MKNVTFKFKKTRSTPEYRVKYEHAAAFALKVAAGISEGYTIHALLSGNFIFGDFIEALAVENGVTIERLTFSTLAISDENVISLGNMLESGFLGHLDMIVSSYFWSHNRSNAEFIYEHLCDNRQSRIAVAGIHTKIAMLQTDKSKIVIHGSANMRSSRTIEAVTIEHNPELFDFHDAWHQKILTDHAVTKRERRGGDLWELVGEKP